MALSTRLLGMLLFLSCSFVFGAFASAPAFAQTAESDALMRQALPLLARHQYDPASRLLYRAAQLAPQDAYVQYNLGIAFSGLKRYREAWQAFAMARQLQPGEASNWIALAHAYGECGDKKNCIAMLHDTQRRFRLSPEEQQNVAGLLAEYGDGRDGAVQGLANLVNSQPQNAEMHNTLAISYLKANRFKEAMSELQTCIKLAPNNPGLYHNLMYCQDKLGDLEGLQATRKQFLQKFPSSKDAGTVAEEITYYDKDFARTRKQEAAAAQSTKPGPFADMKSPVKVYVHDRLSGRTTWSAQQTKTAAAAPKINYSLMVERALDQWTNATGRKITFLISDNPQTANIECQWTPDRSKLHYAFAAGVTSYSYNSLKEPKATIFLLTECEDDNDFLETSLHEIGHAIGLSHSSSPQDVMYSSGQVRTKGAAPALSANDITRVRRLYP
ncbi:MAG: matrixin family metalloprotease [Candidatus Obscuribacterales bacterium]